MAQRITSLENKDPIFEIIADRDVKTILESTRDSPKSAQQIISECNIAESTAYRKLNRLVCQNLLNVRYAVGQSCRWEMRYRSNLCLLKPT
jgi:response regulator of citrate/malate metabolism